MNQWPASKAMHVLAALPRLGRRAKGQTGYRRTLEHTDGPDFVFAFHDSDPDRICLRNRTNQHEPDGRIAALSRRSDNHSESILTT